MSANRWDDEQIAEWIAIITIFLFVSWPYEMIYLSETSLGKLFFAFVVVYFTMVDVAYGMLACGLVIMYYQLDLYRSYVSIHRDTLLKESMMQMEDSIIQGSLMRDTMYRDVRGAIEAYSAGDSSVFSYTPHESDGATDIGRNSFLEHKINTYRRKKELLDYFRKENCSTHGELMYKGSVVRPEMAEHVFREIKFDGDFAKCNPCDKSCVFSIIEDRIVKEDALVHPKNSKAEPIHWDHLVGHYLVKPMENIVDDIQHFGSKLNRFIGDYTK